MFREVDYSQALKHTEQICGDCFMSVAENDGRIISVLSDGLGSGVKANILATMTSSMAIKFVASGMDFCHCAEIMLNALPVCQVRNIAYATYTIVDSSESGQTYVIEQGNPPFIFVRGNNLIECQKQELLNQESDYRKLSFYS